MDWGMIFLLVGAAVMSLGLLAWPVWRSLPRTKWRMALMGERAARTVMVLGGALLALLGVFMIALAA